MALGDEPTLNEGLGEELAAPLLVSLIVGVDDGDAPVESEALGVLLGVVDTESVADTDSVGDKEGDAP